MLRMITVFFLSLVILCQSNCLFSSYENVPGLASKLEGTLYVAYASVSSLRCERHTWTNNTAYVESSDGCCMQIVNYDTSNSALFNYNINYIKGTGCNVVSTQHGTTKLIAQLGTGDSDLCLIISVCRDTREGVVVMCRQPDAASSSLLNQIFYTLGNLLLILLVPGLRAVDQTNCFIAPGNCNV